MKLKKLFAGVGTTAALVGGGTVAVDQAVINPYTDKGATLSIKKDSALTEAGKVEVEAVKSQPKILLKKWNGEVAMGVKSLDLPSNTTGGRPFLSKNVEWQSGDVTMEAVPLDAGAGHEDGGVEINILLDAPPASNKFDFAIDGAEDLDFFYQPPLTAEDIKDGTIRPENVVGSYAVYYKNHANHKVGSTNYATGKAYHIYRPLVTDAIGSEVWAEMSYAAGTLSITVPQGFLDNATYPVKIDPTFGQTTCGASNVSMLDNGIYGAVFTSPSDATTVTKLTRCLSTDAAHNFNIKAVLVASSTLAILANGVGPATNITATTKTMIDLTVFGTPPSISPNTVYVLSSVSLGVGGTCGGTYNCSSSQDTAAGTTIRDGTNSYASPTDPSDSPTITGNRLGSIYATYTASGGDTPVPTVQIQGPVNIGGPTSI